MAGTQDLEQYRRSGIRAVQSTPLQSRSGRPLGMSALVRQLGDVAPVGQMVFFRSAFAILPVVLVYAIRGELATAVRTTRPLGQLGRGLLSVGGMPISSHCFWPCDRLPAMRERALPSRVMSRI